jgi:hypothetical protein
MPQAKPTPYGLRLRYVAATAGRHTDDAEEVQEVLATPVGVADAAADWYTHRHFLDPLPVRSIHLPPSMLGWTHSDGNGQNGFAAPWCPKLLPEDGIFEEPDLTIDIIEVLLHCNVASLTTSILLHLATQPVPCRHRRTSGERCGLLCECRRLEACAGRRSNSGHDQSSLVHVDVGHGN